jgi:threonine-phosphate decarboxylase
MGARRGVAHGALDHEELAALGISPVTLLDFSSNVNPFGPPAGVRAALSALDPAPYPDRSCHALRLVLAARHDCSPNQILPGNGANELIHLLARALLGPGAVALIAGPTFGEYAHASGLAGAQIVEVRTHEQGQFQLDLEALTATIGRSRPRLIWLCAPNNPTGADLLPDEQAALCAACASHGGLLVLDHAYRDLRRDGCVPRNHAVPSNLVQLHALTKSYALAGLRLGYLLADAGLIARVAAYQPAWSVSSAAQAAGLAALDDTAFLSVTVPQLWAASDELFAALTGLGLHVWRNALPFMLVHTGDGAATRAALLARCCAVRDCASFGLPARVRVAPRRPAENLRLVEAWKELR